MARSSVTIPITWEKGLWSSQEDSVLPEGYASVLENLVPEPTGGLRARRGWNNASTTGAPATRRTRGIGSFTTAGTFSTPALRQSQDETGEGTTASKAWSPATSDGSLVLAGLRAKARPKRRQDAVGSITQINAVNVVDFDWVASGNAEATWDSATESGSLLLAVVMAGTTGQTPIINIATPSGWTLRTTLDFNWGSGWTDNQIRVFEIQNAGSRSGTESILVDGGTEQGAYTLYVQAFLVEVAGVATASAFDVGTTATGTSSTASSGTTGATTQADEYVFAALFSDELAQTNVAGQTQIAASTSGIFQHGLYEKRPETTGTQNITATLGSSDRWAGVIVTYKALTTAPTITPPAGWTAVQTDTEGPMRATLYDIVDADPRSGSESFTLDRNCDWALSLAEYTGGLTFDTAVDAVASGTSTAPSVAGAGATTVAVNQKGLLIGFVGVGQDGSAQSAPGGGFAVVDGVDEGLLYSKVITANETPTVSATLSVSAPWVAIVSAYESGATGEPQSYLLVADDDATNFDIYSVLVEGLASGSWTSVDPNLAVTDRSLPVAFASGLGLAIWTHPGLANTRKWDGTTAANLGGTPPEGRAAAFYRNRFFIGSTDDLYFTALGNAEDWTGTDAGNLAVGQGDGEDIEDLASLADGLVIAKRSSLWFLSGTGPDNFELHPLIPGKGYPGRCLCPTPYGVVVASQKQVWLWSGGAPQVISDGIEGQYDVGGAYLTTAYADDVAYICDRGTGTIWAYDLRQGTWWTETVQTASEKPATIASHEDHLLYGPSAGVTISLLAYRDEPGGERQRDRGMAETLRATSPLVPLPIDRPFTPLHLFLQIRQRGGDSTDVGLVITPVYNDDEATAKTVSPKDGGDQVFRTRVDVPSAKALFRIRFETEQVMTTTDEAVLEIEKAELHGQLADPSGNW
jgi:hypothetical protein